MSSACRTWRAEGRVIPCEFISDNGLWFECAHCGDPGPSWMNARRSRRAALEFLEMCLKGLQVSAHAFRVIRREIEKYPEKEDVPALEEEVRRLKAEIEDHARVDYWSDRWKIEKDRADRLAQWLTIISTTAVSYGNPEALELQNIASRALK